MGGPSSSGAATGDSFARPCRPSRDKDAGSILATICPTKGPLFPCGSKVIRPLSPLALAMKSSLAAKSSPLPLGVTGAVSGLLPSAPLGGGAAAS